MSGATLHALICCTMLLNIACLTAIRVPVARGREENLTCAGIFTLRGLDCYSYSGSELRRSFHAAQKHCSKLSASLTSLLSPAEETFVLQLVNNDSVSIWIGLTDWAGREERERSKEVEQEEEKFRWTDGEVMESHSHWREGEPIIGNHLHCVMADSQGWALARGGCASTKLPFVCKRRACPAGLEWSGEDCDIITTPSSSSSTSSSSSSSSSSVFSWCPDIVLLLSLCLLLLLVMVYLLPHFLHHHLHLHRHPDSTHYHHPLKHCHHGNKPHPTTNHIQDIWLS